MAGVAVSGRACWLVTLALGACGHPAYHNAIGYRARQAALQQNVEAFDTLMKEASEKEPKPPLYDPKRTVLVHYFDLADRADFMARIERWRASGWVDEAMTCAIHRAQWAGAWKSKPAVAARSMEICLERARKAAANPSKAWEVEACLSEAPFLTRSSTITQRGLAERVTDAAEPLGFRRALLEALADPGPLLTKTTTTARARIEDGARRLDRLLQVVLTSSTPLDLVSSATAKAALRLERGMVPFGTSYMATHSEPVGGLAWGWVRTMKANKKMKELEALGLWDEVREGAGDKYWYACPVAVKFVDSPLGRLRILSLRTYRYSQPKVANDHCDDAVGPFPLEVTTLGAASMSSGENETRTVVRVVERKRQ